MQRRRNAQQNEKETRILIPITVRLLRLISIIDNNGEEVLDESVEME
jgi:hypothetical protein